MLVTTYFRNCLSRLIVTPSFQSRISVAVLAAIVLLVTSGGTSFAHEDNNEKGIGNSAPAGIGGNGPYDHRNINLLSRLSLAEMGAGQSNVLGNDIWGWTDSNTGKEFAIFGMTNGTAFVDISNPYNPQYLGRLNTHTGNKSWRDMKVYNDHVYIVSDANGAHGMQVFNLNDLTTVDPQNPQTFSATAHYSGFNRAHNIAINEQTGYAYVVGSEVADGGLHVLDLNSPTSPVHVGDFDQDGYTHDVQVVNYIGPDSTYAGREIAFASNEDTLTIVDVTNKNNMEQVSRVGYGGSEYSHQGWLSEDQRYFFMNDELDERRSENLINTRTHVWNVEDLENPEYLGFHNGEAATIDHNLYVKDGKIYQANYTSGLRVIDIIDAENLEFEEFGYFDTYNTDNNVTFNGAWSVYPFFDSGTIIVSDRQNGLFLLELSSVPEPASGSFLAMAFLAAAAMRRRRRRS